LLGTRSSYNDFDLPPRKYQVVSGLTCFNPKHRFLIQLHNAPIPFQFLSYFAINRNAVARRARVLLSLSWLSLENCFWCCLYCLFTSFCFYLFCEHLSCAYEPKSTV